MNLTVVRDKRPSILLAVVAAHVAVVYLATHVAWRPLVPRFFGYDPIRLLPLPKTMMDREHLIRYRSVPAPTVEFGRRDYLPDRPPMLPHDTISTLSPTAPITPPVDWDQELQTAIQESLLAAEKHKQYRDLSGLSSAQLEWVRHNQMVPMPPDFAWDHRRRDNGNPLGVIWIGQHCALVWLIPFCRIGHIEANGKLFEHMRDPKEP